MEVPPRSSSSESKASVGRRVALLRRKESLTREQLAQQAGMSVALVRQVENGRRTVSSPLLARLADVLGTSPEYLLTGLVGAQGGSSERALRSVPPSLESAADEEDWSFSSTMALLDAVRVGAERSVGVDGTAFRAPEQLAPDDWRALHRILAAGEAPGVEDAAGREPGRTGPNGKEGEHQEGRSSEAAGR